MLSKDIENFEKLDLTSRTKIADFYNKRYFNHGIRKKKAKCFALQKEMLVIFISTYEHLNFHLDRRVKSFLDCL